MTRWLAASIT